MMYRMQGKKNIPPLLVGMQTYTSTVEIITIISPKIRNQFTSRLRNTTLGNMPKGCTLIPQGYLLNCVYSCIIHNS